MIALAGILGLEAINSMRILAKPAPHRSFPQGYVSRGIWCTYGLVRPLDSTSTDIAPTLEAAHDAIEGDAALYRDFNALGSSYIYPPTTAIELAPYGLAVSELGMPRATQIVDLVNRVATAGLVVIALMYLRGMGLGTVGWILAAITTLAFFPIRWSLFCVQAQTLVNVLLAGAVLAYGTSRGATSGLLVGLAACIKPHFAVLALFGVVRRQWRMAIVAIVTGGVLILISILVLGFEPWRTYLDKIVPFVSNGYAWDHNQSFNGLARRWLGDPDGFRITPASTGVRAFTAITSIALIFVALWPRRVPAPEASEAQDVSPPAGKRMLSAVVLRRSADFGIAALALTMASPVAWNHHYGWTVVLFAVGIAAGIGVGWGIRFYTGLAVIYMLAATSWVPVTPAHPGLISLVNSKLLFAAIALLLVTWRVAVAGHRARSDD